MVGGRQHVDVREVVGNRQRAHELRPVDEHDRTHRPRDRADRTDVGAVPGRGLHAAERDQHGAVVDAGRDVVGLQPAVAERDLPHVVALVREQPPRIMVRAVLAFADDDVLPGVAPAPNCAATSPAAADTDAISAMSDGSAPIRAATEARAVSPAASPRAKSSACSVHSST